MHLKEFAIFIKSIHAVLLANSTALVCETFETPLTLTFLKKKQKNRELCGASQAVPKP